MSELTSGIKDLAGKFDELIKEAKQDKFDKTAKAAGDVRAMFINAVGTDPKPETVTFYEAKFALLGKILQARRQGAANRVHQPAKEGDRKRQGRNRPEDRESGGGVHQRTRRQSSHGVVEKHRKALKILSDSLDKVDNEEEAEDDEEDEGGPCLIKNKNFLVAQLNHLPKLKDNTRSG